MKKVIPIVGIIIILIIIYNCWYSALEVDFITKENNPIIVLSRV